MDADAARLVDQAVIVSIVVEELGDEEGRAALLLFLHVDEVGIQRRALDVSLGIARRTQRKLIGREIGSEVGRMGEVLTIFRFVPDGLIPAQAQDVFDPLFLERAGELIHRLGRRRSARDMRERIDVGAVLNIVGDLHRIFGVGATRAVRHADEVGAKPGKFIDGRKQLFSVLAPLLGREHLKGERALVLQNFVDPHNHTVLCLFHSL